MGFDIIDTKTVLEPEAPEESLEAYGALLNGVMNHGAKTVTALSLDEQPRGKTGIYRQAVKEAGHNPEAEHKFIPGRATPKDYCSESFLDIGLIAEGRITEAGHPQMEGGTTYSISQFGKHMQPILAYSIKKTSEAEELDDMHSVLGATYSSGDERSPLKRARALNAIRDGSGSQIELSEITGDSVDRTASLTRRLDEEGVLNVTRPNTIGGHYFRATDTLDPNEVEPVKSYPGPTREVAKALKDEQVLNVDSIQERTRKSSTIREILRKLEDRGDVEKLPNFQLTQKGEEALDILDETAYAVNQYVGSGAQTMDEALNAMPSYINEVWEEYQEDTQRFRREYNRDVWNASRLNSSKVDALEPKEASNRVGNIVREAETPLTVEEVAERWDEQYPEKRTNKTIGSYLRKNESLASEDAEDGYEDIWYIENPE